MAAHSRIAGLSIFHELLKLDLCTAWKLDTLNWFTSGLRGNKQNLSHYLDSIRGCGLKLEVRAQHLFFAVLATFVKELHKCEDTRECRILMGALKWRYLSRDHESLYKLNIFETLHRGSDKLRRLWGKPV